MARGIIIKKAADDRAKKVAKHSRYRKAVITPTYVKRYGIPLIKKRTRPKNYKSIMEEEFKANADILKALVER